VRAFKDLAEGRKRTIELCSNPSFSSEELQQGKDRLVQGTPEIIENFTKIVDTDLLILELD
jgi:hypothetical protein